MGASLLAQGNRSTHRFTTILLWCIPARSGDIRRHRELFTAWAAQADERGRLSLGKKTAPGCTPEPPPSDRLTAFPAVYLRAQGFAQAARLSSAGSARLGRRPVALAGQCRLLEWCPPTIASSQSCMHSATYLKT